MLGDLQNARVIVLLGAPGSGKGTQSARLSAELGIPVLSTGEMLRAQAKRSTTAGRGLKKLLAAGHLVSDEIICNVVEARLSRDLRISPAGVILDGFPRTLAQAKRLDSLLKNLGLDAPLVIHLGVRAKDVLERLTSRRQCPVCGAIYNLRLLPSRRGVRCETDGAELVQRDDDREEVVALRLADFETLSAPVIAHYGNGDYHQVAATGRPDEISGELIRLMTRSLRRAAA